MEIATPMRRMFAFFLDFVLLFATLFVGYAIWLAIVLGRGQTPGKQLLGIRVVRPDGMAQGWAQTWFVTFAREAVKFVAHCFVIGFFADVFLLLLDDSQRRSMSDRVAGTVVVRERHEAAPAIAG